MRLFEFMDLAWFPRALRDAETNYLSAALAIGRVFAPLAPTLARVMGTDDRIVDLAAGGAGPWPSLAEAIAKERSRAVMVTLTDLRPNVAAYERLGYAYEPGCVDARAVPAHLGGTRTMFDGLHHLAHADARQVLEDAHRSRAPIVIAEAMSRRVPVLLSTLLIPLFVLLITPRARPSVLALVFTYLVPILPLVIWWDGLVSCLRTSTPAELLALTHGLDGYRWETDRIGTVTYLVGAPT